MSWPVESSPVVPTQYLAAEDLDLYNKYDNTAFELQVANHELLGHGTGKLFQEDANGKLNFDPAKVCIQSFGLTFCLKTLDRRSTR